MSLLPIPFNRPAVTGKETHYIGEAMHRYGWLAGDYHFTEACSAWFHEKLDRECVLLTSSCTHAIEMAALLLEIQPGDEVIMPSFTFVSTATAFVLRGAVPVFVDIRPDTMNMDETLVEAAITLKTRAIVAMHYGGVACEMDTLMAIAARHGIDVVEDAAHGLMAGYKGRMLGTIGRFGTYSFHETKNYTSGEGGAFVVNDPRDSARARIIRQKGTNRAAFLAGEVDKYTWVDTGSSYVMSELNAAYLLAQLEHAEIINQRRLALWNRYYQAFLPLLEAGRVTLPTIPAECSHNAHLFYLKLKDKEERSRLIAFLKQAHISAVFHYIPLHSSPAGMRFGRMHGADNFTARESERLLRLPLFYNLADVDQERVIARVSAFFAKGYV
jgi:dTDP-4-amino-4,6-dideoxygalactose transaminase